MGVPLRSAVPLHAADRARLLGVELLRQQHVPACAELLLCHHFLGLQWYEILTFGKFFPSEFPFH